MTLELWTRVECLCGRCAAIPEAGFFPLCGGCGRRMVAPAGQDSARISMVCEPMDTNAAIERCQSPGIWIGNPPVIPGHTPVYTAGQLEEALSARGYPTEAQDWPTVLSGDGLPYPVPPWETD